MKAFVVYVPRTCSGSNNGSDARMTGIPPEHHQNASRLAKNDAGPTG
jgi:hypothetical protein